MYSNDNYNVFFLDLKKKLFFLQKIHTFVQILFQKV